ncbi:hypothetical protein HDU86_002417 [Geranomyces michiganensis]|nr:hypothetical protein HDU86_002417 [Geranomyces michiganensis]
MKYPSEQKALSDLQSILQKFIAERQESRAPFARAEDAAQYLSEEDPNWVEYWSSKVEKAALSPGSSENAHQRDSVADATPAAAAPSDDFVPSYASATELAALDDLLQSVVTPNEVLEEIREILGDLPIHDLSPTSATYRKLPKAVADKYEDYMDAHCGRLYDPKFHEWLDDFFAGQNGTATQWLHRLDEARSPDPEISSLIRVISASLPQFLKAFELEFESPLSDSNVTENIHLNSFVHPTLEAACWHVARVHYVYGEIPLKPYHVPGRQKSDGLGISNTPDKFPIIYFEGAKPDTTSQKETLDNTKIITNMKKMYGRLVMDQIVNRRRLPKALAIFSGQGIARRIRLGFMEYSRGFSHEVDVIALPRSLNEMNVFVPFYEGVLKWALLLRETVNSLDKTKASHVPAVGRTHMHSG